MPDEKARARRILKFFGLSMPEWDRISVHQSGCCAICFRKPKPGKNLSTDHCHKTGLIRGLLCNICNRLLGKIESQWSPDPANAMMVAIAYLLNPPAIDALGRKAFTFAGRLGTKRHRAAMKKAKR